MRHQDQPADNVACVRRTDAHIILGQRRRPGPLGIIAMGLLLSLAAVCSRADVVPISSIDDIVDATTIDFEEPGSTANDILPMFDMTATPDVVIDTLTIPITGNSDAPIANRALFPAFAVLRIQTTGKPWNQIGLTGAATILGASRTLTLRAFDTSNVELGSVTRVFAPVDSSFEAFNAAAVFLGLSSTTPIHAIELTSDNPNTAWDSLTFSVVLIPVTIDIKPGSFPNSINPKSNGRIPVAILTTDRFDATTVDPATVLFGRTGTEAAPVHFALEDVDADGNTDIILHFKTQQTGIGCGDDSATLRGEVFGGRTIGGSDSIRTVGCK